MKITKIISGIAAGVLAAFCMAFTAFAEPQDIELPVARAIETNGLWGQSITYSRSEINPEGIGPDTIFEVNYELNGDPSLPGQYQVELILQNYDVDPQIWAQVVPYEYDDTHALFDYDSMVLAYGSDDLSGVCNFCIGDRGIKMTVTSAKIINYDPPAREVVTTAATEAQTEEVTEATEAPAETTAAETTAAPNAEEGSGNSVAVIVVIIVAVVLVAAIVVVIIVTKKNKKRFY
ncbi:MAG: hypothetical protein ACI4JK_10590 [Oscillospiraceae bacterium]